MLSNISILSFKYNLIKTNQCIDWVNTIQVKGENSKSSN